MNIGGTKIEIGYEHDGQFILWPSIPTPHDPDPHKLLQHIVVQLRSIETKCLVEAKALGIAIAGPTNARTGVVSQTPNIGWETPFNLGETLGNSLGMPVVVYGDTKAEALGELHLGEYPGCKNFVYITVGIGIGTGIISDGRLFHGSTGAAGEIGHIKMTSRLHGADRRLCGCGGYGCVEAYIAGPALASEGKFLAHRDNIFRKWLRQELIAEQNIDGAVLARAAAQDIKSAKRVVNETVIGLAHIIATTIQAYNPSVVVLGGGLMRSPEAYFHPLAKLVNDELMPALKGTAKIRLAQVPYCGVRGAILLTQPQD